MSSTELASGTIRYHEPSPPRLLTLISFVYLLQVARQIANLICGAGLLGEIAMGVIYGPVAKILPVEWEETFLVIGYFGLCLIVFEGGLDIKPKLFVPAIPLSTVAALVGILCPLAFTFALFHGFGYPTLHAFTAGSALASTSLGTTFYVLRAQSTPPLASNLDNGSARDGSFLLNEAKVDLSETRIGVILQAAALIDDVIALILLAVITSLGASTSDSTTNLGWTIGRPIVASAAMAIVAPPCGYYIARPLFKRLLESRVEQSGLNAELFLGVTVLSAFLAIAYYAGTTMLLGAYLAGVFLHSLPSDQSTIDFLQSFHTNVGPLQERIFAPFFFASIGFSIPFLQMWTGRIIWRGIIYSILMAIGKTLVGIVVLVHDSISAPIVTSSATPRKVNSFLERPPKKKRWFDGIRGAQKDWSNFAGVVIQMTTFAERDKSGNSNLHKSTELASQRNPEKLNVKNKKTSPPKPFLTAASRQGNEQATASNTLVDTPQVSSTALSNITAAPLTRRPEPSKLSLRISESLPSASFLGLGLVARGEIGVLVLQVAIGSPNASRVLDREAYLVALWAVGLCTIVGPICMGWLCRSYGQRIVQSSNWGGLRT